MGVETMIVVVVTPPVHRWFLLACETQFLFPFPLVHSDKGTIKRGENQKNLEFSRA